VETEINVNSFLTQFLSRQFHICFVGGNWPQTPKPPTDPNNVFRGQHTWNI